MTTAIDTTVKRNGTVLPNLSIDKNELKTVSEYDSLADFLERGTVLIVTNKVNDRIRLVGRLKKERDMYFVEGSAFEQADNGKNKIAGDSYARPIRAKYGLTKEEFEKRRPHYIADSKKSSLIGKEIKAILRFPQSTALPGEHKNK